MAKSAVCHSGQLGAKRPTRSPDFTPSSTKALAKPATRRRNSCEEMDSQRSGPRNIWARGDGCSSTALRKRVGRVPYFIGKLNLHYGEFSRNGKGESEDFNTESAEG